MATFTLGTAGIVQPNAQKMTTANSYLDLRTSGWAQQYLPELYTGEAQVILRCFYRLILLSSPIL